MLFSKKPDYSSLHPFGYTVYPCLTPYNKHKLQYHSQKCVFIGYNNNKKGYKCLAPSRRLFVSKHVIFNHIEYPYLTLFYPKFSSHSNQSSCQPFFITDNLHSTTVSSFLPSHAADQSFSPLSSHYTSENSDTRAFSDSPEPEISDSCSDSSSKYMLAPDSTGLHQSDSISNTTESSTRYMLAGANYALHPCPEPVGNKHPMLTRGKRGITKLSVPFVGSTVALSVPKTVAVALVDPTWLNAMKSEFKALQQNHTWSLVPSSTNIHIVGSKWIFKLKYN